MLRLPPSVRALLSRGSGRHVVSAALAVALALTVVMRFGPEWLREASGRWWGVGALALLVSWPLNRGLGVLVGWLQAYSRWGRAGWLLGSLAGAALLIIATPLSPPRFPETFRLEVTATGGKSEASQNTEVWVAGIHDATSGQRLDLEPKRVSGQWEEKYGKLLSVGRPVATLRWEGVLKQKSVLKLTRHGWSGQARVTLNGETQTVDLFSAAQEDWVLPLETASTANGLLSALFRLAELVSIGLLLLSVGAGLASWSGPERVAEPSRWGWLAPAGVCAASWSFYLLSFWPGFMTADSIDQWTQMTRGPLSNQHPAYHTLTNWLLTRVWESPAAVAITQIVALSLAFAFALRELGRWGAPAWLRGVLTVLVALTPVNGAMVITLWKDIAYTISMLVLFTLLLQVARTRGEALRSTRFLVGMGVTLTYTALMRHNGVLVVFALLGGFILISPKALRRRAAVLALAVASTFVLMSGPLYKVLGVQPMNGLFAHIFQIHHVGAIVRASPESLTAADRQLLEDIQPWQVWRDNYYCYAINPLVYNGKIDGNFFETPRKKEFTALWLRQVPKHLEVLAEHQACVTSMVWRILQPTDGYLYLFNFDMEPNRLGLVQEPKLPAVRQELVRVLNSSFKPKRLWWVWRPAPYLYLTLFLALIAAARLRSAWVLLPVVPVALNSAVLLGINLAQDFRYQYPVYVVALLSPAFLFMRRGALRAQETVTPPVSLQAASEPPGEREESRHAVAS